ncbi:hypothetical protein J3R83DRAFT_11819 [Lanmaoa asiatica]|nr:hypothetical protein J3R83DRAFT_11819 [Lanmaoa asiatica]
MAQNSRCWIVDGDYRALGTLVPDNATDIICGFVRGCVVLLTYKPALFRLSLGLDPPLHHYLPRLLWRTLMRLLGLSSSCAEGCEDTWGEAFSSKGIVWYCIANHGITRTKYTAWLSRMSVEVGGKMIRLDESCGELANWRGHLEEYHRQM